MVHHHFECSTTLGFSMITAAMSSLSICSKSGAILSNTGFQTGNEFLASNTWQIKVSSASFACKFLNPGVFGLKKEEKKICFDQQKFW